MASPSVDPFPRAPPSVLRPRLLHAHTYEERVKVAPKSLRLALTKRLGVDRLVHLRHYREGEPEYDRLLEVLYFVLCNATALSLVELCMLRAQYIDGVAYAPSPTCVHAAILTLLTQAAFPGPIWTRLMFDYEEPAIVLYDLHYVPLDNHAEMHTIAHGKRAYMWLGTDDDDEQHIINLAGSM